MLLVLAKEIYECWLVSEDIILLTRKIIYTYLYVCIYVEKGGGGAGVQSIFVSLFLRPYYVFSTTHEPFYFFLAYQEPKYF